MSSLTAARYGKDNVRILKVDRDPSTGIQKCTEMTVCVLLAGDIETSYTQADNSVVVATDSTKNTIHILAKTTPINPPELFASTLATHFVRQYGHIHETFVKVVTHRWTRLEVDGKSHPHSFHRDGVETRNVDAHFSRTGGLNLRSSIVGLHVLKTTGSQFHSFVRDEYTTLKETWDRILSTEVDAVWEWRKFTDLEDVRGVANEGRFDKAWELARYVTLKTFCEDNSASVQATMYKMAQEIIAKTEGVEHVEYSLPNKHFFEIDLSWHKGLKNTGKDAEVYAPQSNPNGLIKCRVSRNVKSKL